MEKYSDLRRKQIISELQDKVTMEFRFNLENSNKSRRQPISFGQQIQLLHVASNRFLSCHFESAEQESENFKLHFDDFSSDATIF